MPASLIRKLESIFHLSEDERAALESLPIQVANFGPDQDIVRIGDRPSRCFLVRDGFTCSYKITGEGTRQILNFYISGDVPDLQSLHLNVLDHSIPRARLDRPLGGSDGGQRTNYSPKLAAANQASGDRVSRTRRGQNRTICSNPEATRCSKHVRKPAPSCGRSPTPASCWIAGRCERARHLRCHRDRGGGDRDSPAR